MIGSIHLRIFIQFLANRKANRAETLVNTYNKQPFIFSSNFYGFGFTDYGLNSFGVIWQVVYEVRMLLNPLSPPVAYPQAQRHLVNKPAFPQLCNTRSTWLGNSCSTF